MGRKKKPGLSLDRGIVTSSEVRSKFDNVAAACMVPAAAAPGTMVPSMVAQDLQDAGEAVQAAPSVMLPIGEPMLAPARDFAVHGPSVMLSDDVEESILEFLNHAPVTSSLPLPPFRPPSLLRLNAQLDRVLACGFTLDMAEEGFRAVARNGQWRATDVLDWLCLTCPVETLPKGLTDKKLRESLAPGTVPLPDVVPEPIPAEQHHTLAVRASAQPEEIDCDTKAWVLEFAARQEEADDALARRTAVLDPATQLQQLTVELVALKTSATAAKLQNERARQTTLTCQIRATLSARRTLLEQNPGLHLVTEARAVDTASVLPPAVSHDNLFHDSDAWAMPSVFDLQDDTAQHRPTTHLGLVQRALPIASSWTGHKPKDLLIELWKSKHSNGRVRYQRIANPHGLYLYKVLLEQQSKGSVRSYEGNAVTTTASEGQNLAATVALFDYFGLSESLKMRLPPSYQAVWEELHNEVKAVTMNASIQQQQRRANFINHLQALLTACCGSASRQGPNIPAAALLPFLSQPTSASEPTTRTNVGAVYASGQQSGLAQRFAPARAKLPILSYSSDILAAIHTQQVVLISGATGCGKSTQVPHVLLKDAIDRGQAACARIVCTQPRRISATSIARHVCHELGQSVMPNLLCGYQVRLDSKCTSETRIIYSTIGILLRRIQSDPQLRLVSHLVVDEVHERSADSDFLLILIKQLLSMRPDLKVILMSATFEAQRLSAYFGYCPVVNVPGRTYPVEIMMLEDIAPLVGHGVIHEGDEQQRQHGSIIDYPLVEKTIIHAARQAKSAVARGDPAAILVFLPGYAEIRRLWQMLMRNPVFYESDSFTVLPLHSSLSWAEQSAVFEVPKAGTQKVVLATNIAETGITVDDVVYVIDTLRAKEKRYQESTRTSALVETWISKASAQQRAGRAGRVQAGFCFRLISERGYDRLAAQGIPELLRIPLEKLCLQLLQLQIPPGRFLREALDPPPEPAIRAALDMLMEVGAVVAQICDNGDELGEMALDLTSLGQVLARLPLDIHLGKMVVFGVCFCCLEPVLTIAAAMSYGSPFKPAVFGANTDVDRARLSFSRAWSDQVTISEALAQWRRHQSSSKEERQFCLRHALHRETLQALEEIKVDLMETLAFAELVAPDAKFDAQKYNLHSRDDEVLSAVIACAHCPKVVLIEGTAAAGKPLCTAAKGTLVHLHPTSVLHHSPRLASNRRFLAVYHEKSRASNGKLFVRDLTIVSPLALVLFCDSLFVDHGRGTILVDNWLLMKMCARTAVVLKKLRELLSISHGLHLFAESDLRAVLVRVLKGC